MSLVYGKLCKVGGKDPDVLHEVLTCMSTSGICRACSVGKAREAPRHLVSKRAPSLFTMPYYLLAQQERSLLGPNQVPGEVQGPRDTRVTEPGKWK